MSCNVPLENGFASVPERGSLTPGHQKTVVAWTQGKVNVVGIEFIFVASMCLTICVNNLDPSALLRILIGTNLTHISWMLSLIRIHAISEGNDRFRCPTQGRCIFDDDYNVDFHINFPIYPACPVNEWQVEPGPLESIVILCQE